MALPCCSTDVEMSTMAGSAVAFSKNLINRISTRFRPKKPLLLKPIRSAPERVSFSSLFFLYFFVSKHRREIFCAKIFNLTFAS